MASVYINSLPIEYSDGLCAFTDFKKSLFLVQTPQRMKFAN